MSVNGASSQETAFRYAERTLKVLLVSSIVLPTLTFAGVAWIGYHEQFTYARDRLDRTLGNVHEHATKVFETFELSARYVDEVLEQVSNQEILANEQRYHTSLRGLTDLLPQLADVWIVDAHGRPVVAGTVYPIPRDLDLRDREYFRIHINNPSTDLQVGEVLTARAADLQFFAISRRRNNPDGSFGGVMTISVSPAYFARYYATLPDEKNAVFALVRKDGAVLARHPTVATPGTRLASNAPLLNAIAQNPEAGFHIGHSSIERDVERMVAYRKLPRHDVYIAAAIATSDVRNDWLRLMVSHLMFGIPATAAMFGLAWVALRRSQREARAHAELRAEVARRQTTEQALAQAQKMEAVGRLTGGIAHDFNNLLTAILGNIDLVLRRLQAPEERIRRSLDNAREATQRAATLVQRLLTFSRQHPQEIRVVDLNRVVRDMSDLLQRTIGETVTIETVLAAGLWKASVDPHQLENAILNLAVNARDAMPGGGKLTIETANSYLDEDYAAANGPDLCAGQCVMVAISDTGSGMSREVMQKAFDPFFTTKPQGAGTGLGLSMVYGFVKQSNGHVKIYSEIGHGTTIKMYFPRNVDDEAAEWTGARDEKGASPTSTHAETILVVEDDEAVMRFSTEVLAELGYRVLSAGNAQAALELLGRNSDIQLLFTDVILPGGMNGRELAREAQRKRANLCVLFTTGYTRNAIVHHGRLDPDVEVLMKPFTHDALARKVRAMLDAAGSSGAAPT
jgi:two-component system NtrC family sensor kinase